MAHTSRVARRGNGCCARLSPRRTSAASVAMPTLSMNEVTTFRWSLEEDVRHYVAAGYEGIGVWRRKLADHGEEQGVDLIAESGLRVTNLVWAGGFTGSDGRTLDESVQDARARAAAGRGAGRGLPRGVSRRAEQSHLQPCRAAAADGDRAAAGLRRRRRGGDRDRADAPGVRGGVDVSDRPRVDRGVHRAVRLAVSEAGVRRVPLRARSGGAGEPAGDRAAHWRGASGRPRRSRTASTRIAGRWARARCSWPSWCAGCWTRATSAISTWS